MSEVKTMTSADTASPLVVIERADALTGSGWMNARQAAYYTSSRVRHDSQGLSSWRAATHPNRSPERPDSDKGGMD
jgi:hypothetical protein